MDANLPLAVRCLPVCSTHTEGRSFSCAHVQVLGSGGGGAGQDEGWDDNRALLRLLLQGALDLGGDAKVHWEVFYKWHQRWDGAAVSTKRISASFKSC